MEGLEFYTSEQLVAELMGRSTFAGIILYSDTEQRAEEQVHDSFNLLTKADTEDTIAILEKATMAIREGMQQG